MSVGVCSKSKSAHNPEYPDIGIPCTGDGECIGLLDIKGNIAMQPQQAVDGQQGLFHKCEDRKCSNNNKKNCSTDKDCPYTLIEFCAGDPQYGDRPQNS